MNITVFLKSLLRYFYLNRGIITNLLIIGLVGLLSVSWFRGDYLISAVDFSMPLDRIRSFIANFYVWDSRSLGGANPRILAFTFPVWMFFAFSEIVSLTVVNAEKILFYCVFTLSGLSMYYMTTALICHKNFKFKRLAGLISGIFYMLNPYVAINIMPLRQVSYIIYALLPLVFSIFVKGLNEKRGIKFAMVTALVTSLATSVYVDPSFIPLTLLPLFIYLLFFILINLKKTVVFSAFKFTTAFLAIWAILNLYWLIPDVSSYSSELEKVASGYNSIGMSFQSTVQLNSAPILGAIRLLGFWALDSGYKGDPYFTWASTYQNPILIVISFLVPLLTFVALLLKPKDKHVLFFTSFTIISLLLVNGSYSPLGNWIYSSVPLFAMFFNTPYLRFGMYVTLAYAFLIGYALTELFNRFTSHLKKIRSRKRKIISGIPIVFALFLIVGVYAFPLWTGDVIRPGTAVLQSNRYKMPAYYQDASDWLGTDASDFKIITLPISKIGYAELKWDNGGYDGPYPAEWLFPKPIITSALAGNGLAGQAIDLITKNSTTAATMLLALMNVKYVLFHKDTNWLYIEDNPSWISSSPEQLQSILDSSDALSLEKTFGELDFYRNNSWSPMHIYAATNSILVDGGLSQMIQITERDDFKPDESVLLLSDQLGAEQLSSLPMNLIFIQDQNFTSYGTLSNAMHDGRVVYVPTLQPLITARYFSGWKRIISTNGQGDPDMIIFQSPTSCPYIGSFPTNFTSWNAHNSTLVYLTTSNSSFRIDEILTDGNMASDISEIWWETGWMGMSTKPVTYPIIIPPNQKAIIQINHKAGNVTLRTNPPQIKNVLLYSLKNGENFADANNLMSPTQTGNTTITYEKINPTKYVVHVNASTPFFLVFSESYHKDWVASIDGQQIPSEHHFMANGFANGWYINKTGTYTVTLEFWPQKLFYIGSTISITTLILCVLYISKDKMKTIHKQYIKKNQQTSST